MATTETKERSKASEEFKKQGAFHIFIQWIEPEYSIEDI